MTLTVAPNQANYLFTPPEPIQITLALENVTGGQVFVSRSLTTKRLHLALTFIDPDGLPIVANEAGVGTHEGGPPPSLLDGDQLVQVDPVAILQPNETITITIQDARAFYAFTKPGRYTVRASLPLRTYPGVYRTETDGTHYALLNSPLFGGAIYSSTIEFFLVVDQDGDGYAFPVPDPRISPHTVADCDDTNAAINPGAPEIPNGVDDDCNPATTDDATAPVTTAAHAPAPNTNGWNQTDVSVTLTATDAGSGVQSLTYSLSGATTGSATVPSDNITLPLTAEGITTLMFFAKDRAGNQEMEKTTTVRIDKTMPTLSFGTATPPPNASGWNKTNVSVPFTASDALSGVANTTPAPSPLILTAEGMAVTGTVTVTDKAGNSAAFTTAAFKIDKTAPGLTVPANFSVNATSPSGAVVTYSTTASDNLTPSPTVACVPPSGNTFPIGATTVTCTATDLAGNATTKSFTVTVNSALTQINDLIANVNNLAGVSNSLKNALTKKLQDAQKLLTQGNITGACGKLKDFIAQVQSQSGRELTVGQATALITDAQRIQAVLGCP